MALKVVCLLLLLGSSWARVQDLPEVINELNTRLGFVINVIYNPEHKELTYLRELQTVPRLVLSSLKETRLNGSELVLQINKEVLFVLVVKDSPLEFIQSLNLQFQVADFLLVIVQKELDQRWLRFVRDVWHLGYIKLLLWHARILYEKQLFPQLQFQPSSVPHYALNRGRISDLHGHKVRVAVYSNPPRCLLYKDKWGRQIYGGYYMKFVLLYLKSINATFTPKFTPSYSARHCRNALIAKTVELCADALAPEPTRSFTVTEPLRMAYANIMVRNANRLGSYRYLIAPFHPTVWCCLLVYIAFIVLFMSGIHWQQQHRWIFSKFLLEAFSSLLFAGFSLRELRGRERYILFVVLFIAGFIYSTYYLCYLKSILTTEVFEAQINTFEQLIEANISLIIDEYDKNLTTRFYMPEILWQVIQVVPNELLVRTRNSFDQRYAYMIFSDRMEIYDYAQQFLKHPRIRHIPINIFFLFAGFPMQNTWFLKHHFSQAWLNAFASGLTQKLTSDADIETMTSSVGFLEFLITEYYEAQSLGLDYFVMPAMSLGLGYGFAFITFVIELTAWRTRADQTQTETFPGRTRANRLLYGSWR